MCGYALQVCEQTSPRLLLREWIIERSKDGYFVYLTRQ